MLAIPKNLLIHSAVLQSSTENKWQSEIRETIAELKKIRIEPSSKLVTSKDNRQITLSAVLFFDLRNSRPLNISFEHGQKILFNGNTYTIETIEELFDNRKLHHYELGLIL